MWKRRIAEWAAWYIVLAVLTCAVKLGTLPLLYPRNIASITDELGGPAVWPLLLGRDLLQTAVLAACTFPFRRMMRPLLLLVIAGTYVSFQELGTYATVDALSATLPWVWRRPLVLLSGWYWLPLFIAAIWLWGALERMRPRRTEWVALGFLVLSVPLIFVGAERIGARAFPLAGFWANVLGAATRASTDPHKLTPPSQAELLTEYRALASVKTPELLTDEVEAHIRPRHVIIVGLETAPRAFYPLATSDELPTFKRMRGNAITSEHHYTTSPYTKLANFSILSGVYSPLKHEPFRCDGLAAVLHKERNYEPTYIDSWILDWVPGAREREQAELLGFTRVLDSDVRRDDGVYEVLIEAERTAFDRAANVLADAAARNQTSLIFIGTMLGHAPWPAAIGDAALDGAARIRQITIALDGLFARLLKRIEELHLQEEVIILVVGDHGLRLADEFASLGKKYEHSDLAFNVPFLLYAPGLIPRQIALPYPTSHVDITPTLLHLVGVSNEGLLHHGGYVLDRSLAERTVFLPNSKLGPVDGFISRGKYVTYNSLTGVASDTSVDADALLQAFDNHTSLVAASMLKRSP